MGLVALKFALLSLLKSMNEGFGATVRFNAIVNIGVLTVPVILVIIPISIIEDELVANPPEVVVGT